MSAAAVVTVAAGVMLVSGGMAAFAASGGTQPFSIPGVYGISAWGSYQHLGARVQVTVCVHDTVRGVYGGAAAAVASAGVHRQAVAAVTVGFEHTRCQTVITRYTAHLVADALSGYRDGKVRQVGHIRQIY